MSETTINIIRRNLTLSFPKSLPGPQGPAGPAGGQSVTFVAGENIGAGRVVLISGGHAYMFQKSNSAHAGRAFGITISSALSGANIDIVISGDVTDAGFSGFTDQILWVGDNGVLTTTFPTTGNIQKAGVGIGSNTVRIDFSTQITY